MELTFLKMYFVKIRLQDKELDDGVINSVPHNDGFCTIVHKVNTRNGYY